MDDEDVATVELEEDEVVLLTFLVTTHGVHIEPAPVLGTLDIPEQARVVRECLAQLRKADESLEARVSLAEDVEEAMKP